MGLSDRAIPIVTLDDQTIASVARDISEKPDNAFSHLTRLFNDATSEFFENEIQTFIAEHEAYYYAKSVTETPENLSKDLMDLSERHLQYINQIIWDQEHDDFTQFIKDKIPQEIIEKFKNEKEKARDFLVSGLRQLVFGELWAKVCKSDPGVNQECIHLSIGILEKNSSEPKSPQQASYVIDVTHAETTAALEYVNNQFLQGDKFDKGKLKRVFDTATSKQFQKDIDTFISEHAKYYLPDEGEE